MKFLLLVLMFLSTSSYAAHFETGSAVPTKELNDELVKLYRQEMKDLPRDTLIKVEGHTDVRGSEASNLNLSKQRAEVVVEFLQHLHFTNIESVGLGESQPIDYDNSLESHAKNRRVVVIFDGTATLGVSHDH